MARRLRLTSRVDSPDRRAPVTMLELFFDLVFVLAVTQVTALVGEPRGVAAYLQALAVLWVVWWMYDGFAWLSNNVVPTTTSTRLPMLVAMAAFLLIAVSLPAAFDEDRWVFAVCYLVIVVVHGVSFLRSTVGSSARAIVSIAPVNLGMCLGLFLAAGLPEDVRWLGWALAGALPLVSLLRGSERDFSLRPAHFAERHRLMLIIALGESVLAVGVSAQGHLTEGGHLSAVLLAMLLVSLLWWTHFADDAAASRVERVLDRPDGVSARTALVAFSLGYLVLVAGLILVEAGLYDAVHDLGHPLGWRVALTMATGAGTYLVGNVFYLQRLGVPGRQWQLAPAAVCLMTAPLGARVDGLAQMAALDLVLVAALVPALLDPGRPDAGQASAGRPGDPAGDR